MQMYEKFDHEARMNMTFQLLNSIKIGVTMRASSHGDLATMKDGNEEVCTSKRERSLICKAPSKRSSLSLPPPFPYPCKSRF